MIRRATSLHRRSRGLTLLEIMIAIFVLTVGAVSLLATFTGISQSIRVSKARTLATNLAQEKIESLKNLSYYRLLVTTSAAIASETGQSGYPYDDSYYPEEDVIVGQIAFRRRVYIQKVSETSGAVVPVAWNAADTGLKLITSYVVWQEGNDWRKVEVNNLRDNPNRAKMDATVNAATKVSGLGLANTSVYAIENMTLGGTTDNLGALSFNVPAGTYNFYATKRGYFPTIVQSTVPDSGTVNLTFNLTQMSSGSVQGQAYIADHLVISEYCPMVNGDDDVEYVELYNPTSQSFVMSNAGVPSYQIEYQKTGVSGTITISPPVGTLYANTTIPSHGYFLVASTPVVKGVAADAYYADPTNTFAVPENRMTVGESGGLRLVSLGVYEASGTVVDALGWGKGAGPFGPDGFREGTGLNLGGGPGGINDSETIERMAYSTSTHAMMDTFPSAGIHRIFGNGFDSDDNGANFVYHNHSDNVTPQNSTMFEEPGAGTPAVGAAAFVDDRLSASTTVSVSTTPGFFNVVSVATGSWDLVVSSKGFVYEQANITVPSNGSVVNVGTIFISSPATKGYLSGRVVNSSLAPLNNIRVESSFGTADYTDASGIYRFQIDPGTHTVTANPDNANTLYTSNDISGIVVNAGEAVNVSTDIVLLQGGTVRGFVSSNGTDPLPGIPMLATSTVTGAVVGSAVTDTYGYYQFPNMAIGSYTITPQLESGESSNPTVVSATVSAGGIIFAGTMTVTNAFATIKGLVTVSSQPITTGALVIAVASPGSIASSYPPDNTQSLRNGTTTYYIASSESDGTYSVPVRGGTAYNIYAWYTTYTNNVPAVQKKTSVITVAAGQTATVNFSW